jgi:hypothetical protein
MLEAEDSRIGGAWSPLAATNIHRGRDRIEELTGRGRSSVKTTPLHEATGS